MTETRHLSHRVVQAATVGDQILALLFPSFPTDSSTCLLSPSAPSPALPARSQRTHPRVQSTLQSSTLSASTPHVCISPLHHPPAQSLADTTDLWRKIRYVPTLAAFHLAHLLSFYVAFPASMSPLPSSPSPLMFLVSICHVCMGVQCRVGACRS